MLVVPCYVLMHIRTNVSTLSTASGTIQPSFATGTAGVSHPILQLHRTSFSSAFEATSVSHCTGSSLPSTTFQLKILWMQMWTKP